MRACAALQAMLNSVENRHVMGRDVQASAKEPAVVRFSDYAYLSDQNTPLIGYDESIWRFTLSRALPALLDRL